MRIFVVFLYFSHIICTLADIFHIAWAQWTQKHIVIEAPTFNGSEFFNNKETLSVVHFAVVDANQNFLYANVGCQGRICDGYVLKVRHFINYWLKKN